MSASAIPPLPGVDDLPFGDANEFMDALSPRHSRWDSEPQGWIFRGQANASWGLTATAVRDPGVFQKYGVPGTASNWGSRKHLLDRLLVDFRDGLNRSGVPIPTWAPRILGDEFNRVEYTGAEPPREAFPLMAFAQHHGLPTLLLDWTRRGWAAAYFAAIDAADPEKTEKIQHATHLAVWALQRAAFSGDLREIFFEAPGGTNPNLRAQDGLFTLHQDEGDASLDAYLVTLRERIPKVPRPQRLILPVSESGKLLRLLAYEGITGASMFPGADGVVKAMRERVLWRP